MKPSKLKRLLIHREAKRLGVIRSSVEMVQRSGALPIQQKTLQRQWYYGKSVWHEVELAGKVYRAPLNALHYGLKPVKSSRVQVCYSTNEERLAKAKATRQSNIRNIGV